LIFSFIDEVTVNKTGIVTFKEEGLIQKVLKYCGMSDCNKKWTPVATMPLGTDVNGKRFDATWDYATAIGMLL